MWRASDERSALWRLWRRMVALVRRTWADCGSIAGGFQSSRDYFCNEYLEVARQNTVALQPESRGGGYQRLDHLHEPTFPYRLVGSKSGLRHLPADPIRASAGCGHRRSRPCRAHPSDRLRTLRQVTGASPSRVEQTFDDLQIAWPLREARSCARTWRTRGTSRGRPTVCHRRDTSVRWSIHLGWRMPW